MENSNYEKFALRLRAHWQEVSDYQAAGLKLILYYCIDALATVSMAMQYRSVQQ